jgi:hypothetical protein
MAVGWDNGIMLITTITALVWDGGEIMGLDAKG